MLVIRAKTDLKGSPIGFDPTIMLLHLSHSLLKLQKLDWLITNTLAYSFKVCFTEFHKFVQLMSTKNNSNNSACVLSDKEAEGYRVQCAFCGKIRMCKCVLRPGTKIFITFFKETICFS
jgi:hypothetical protein